MIKKIIIECEGEKNGEIKPFDGSVIEGFSEQDGYVLSIDTPAKQASEIRKIIYNGVEFVKSSKNDH